MLMLDTNAVYLYVDDSYTMLQNAAKVQQIYILFVTFWVNLTHCQTVIFLQFLQKLYVCKGNHWIKLNNKYD